MLYIFCISVLSAIVIAEEDNFFEDFNNVLNSTDITAFNLTVGELDLKNVTFERITKPLEFGSPVDVSTTEMPSNVSNSSKDRRDFRPSPHLGDIYDFPLSPPSPQAKHSVNFNLWEKPTVWPNNIQLTTESNRNVQTMVKFPTEPTIVTANDYPYPFVKENPVSERSNVGATYEFITITNPERPYYGLPGYGTSVRYPQFTDTASKNSELQGKPNLLDHIPWKKITKFLTAAIPIGLLIGALTPNVINVSPVNTNQSRARFEENESRTKMQLVYSSRLAGDLRKKDCRRRILCELLLSAGFSKNGEEYAEHFLDLFMEQESDVAEKRNELRKMLAAVKQGNCKEFRCDHRKMNGS